MSTAFDQAETLPPNVTFHDRLQDAMAIWEKLVSDSFEDHGNGCRGINNFSDYATIEDLNEVLDADPTGITPAFVLKGMHLRRCQEWYLTFENILNGEVDNDPQLKLHRELANIFGSVEFDDVIREETDEIRRALSHYECNEKTIGALDDFLLLADVRQRAVTSFKDLEVHQFKQGEPTDDAKRYNKSIYWFESVTTAVNAIQLCKQYGMTLCIIADNDSSEEKDVFAYFALFFYDGGTLTMLTDRTEWAHPAQAGLISGRAPGRWVRRQHDRTYFPYDLLGLDFCGGVDGCKYVSKPIKTGLINYEFQLAELKPIKDLEDPKSIVYIAMIFEMMYGKFFLDKFRTKKLSYTMGSVHPVAIDHDPDPRGLINIDNKVKLPPLTKDKLSGKMRKWGRKSQGVYKWAEDRYTDSMPDEALNAFVNRSETLLLEGSAENVDREFTTEVSGWGGGDITKTNYRDSMTAAIPDSFGTVAQLKRDQAWRARFNQAQWVKKNLTDEVLRREDELIAWVHKRLQKNNTGLMDAAVRQELMSGDKNLWDIEYNRLGNENGAGWGWWNKHNYTLGYWNGSKFECCVNACLAKIFFRVKACTAKQVAILCNCKVADLPDLLQHYNHSVDYVGNHLLEDIDPMDWIPQNVIYDRLRFHVRLAFSISGYNELRREAGLPALQTKDWKKYEKERYD